MKRTILIATFIITALSVCISGQTPSKKSDNDEKEKNKVLALAEAYFKASVEMDAGAMERILSDDYIGVESAESVEDFTSYGFPSDKILLIRSFKEAPQGGLRLEAIQMDEYINYVRFYGDTAVLVTKITLKWQGSREELVKKYKFMPRKDNFILTLVAVKKNDTWQVVSTHHSEFQINVRISPDPK